MLQERQGNLSERDRKKIKDLETTGYYYESGLVTSKKMRASLNAGNLLFGKPYEVNMSPRESFRHSKVGSTVCKVLFRSKPKENKRTPSFVVTHGEDGKVEINPKMAEVTAIGPDGQENKVLLVAEVIKEPGGGIGTK